jgi:hypothetical protein
LTFFPRSTFAGLSLTEVVLFLEVEVESWMLDRLLALRDLVLPLCPSPRSTRLFLR